MFSMHFLKYSGVFRVLFNKTIFFNYLKFLSLLILFDVHANVEIYFDQCFIVG